MSGAPRVLIADAVDEKARALLEAEGLAVEYAPTIDHAALVEAAPRFQAIVVRSRSTVSADVLAAGTLLRVVGRAGAGVDNIDLAEATRRGVAVMNTPGGNTVSTAEHTIAMMLALARNIPAADRSVRAMEWKRSRFTGMEVSGKTLGLVGLGRVGQEVASRARGLGMAVVAYDPLVSEDAARKLGVEPVTLASLFGRSDVISVHTPLTPETAGIVGAAAFAACKPGVRIVNCARGGVVDEEDLLRALDDGTVAGAALDVFAQEPPTNQRLVTHPSVVCTPHLGASTEEAQEKVAVQVARQVADFLLGRGAAGAVNAGAIAVAMRDDARPYLRLAERMGAFAAPLARGPVGAIALTLRGEALPDAAPAFLAAFVAGFLSPRLTERVNLVNALTLAAERGIAASSTMAPGDGRYHLEIVAELSSAAGRRVVAGTVFGADDPRIIRLDDYHLDVRPRGEMVVYTNVDRPGMLAKVSGLLASASINIADLSLGRSGPGGSALTVISVDTPLSAELLRELAKIEGISDVHAVRLGPEG